MEKDFIWVKQCVLSCTTTWHFEAVQSLIALFSNKHGKEGDKYTNHLIEALAARVTSMDNHKHDESKIEDIS